MAARGCVASVPAVDHYGAGVGRGGGLDAAQEGQQAGGVVGHAVLGPGGEVELADLVFGRVASLQGGEITNGLNRVRNLF